MDLFTDMICYCISNAFYSVLITTNRDPLKIRVIGVIRDLDSKRLT